MQRVSGWWVVASFVVFVAVMALAQASGGARVRMAEQRLGILERKAEADERMSKARAIVRQPIFPPYPKHLVDEEVDLWHKRLTFETRNEPRRTR